MDPRPFFPVVIGMALIVRGVRLPRFARVSVDREGAWPASDRSE